MKEPERSVPIRVVALCGTVPILPCYSGIVAGAMDATANTVLVIGNDPAVAAVIRDALVEPGEDPIATIWVPSIAAAVVQLGEGGIDAILLDLSLPGSRGVDPFGEVSLAARRIPVLVVAGRGGQEKARQAVLRGAHGRLLMEHIGRSSLRWVVRHVLERAVMDDILHAEQERARVTLDSIGDGVISTDKAGNVTYLNPVAAALTGWSLDEASGRILSDVFHVVDGSTRQPISDPMKWVIRHDRIAGLAHNAVLIRRDGTESAIEDSIAPIHDRQADITGAVIVFRDVSEARAVERTLSHRAQHDVLTDLPNRMLLNDRLDQAIAVARRRGSQLAVLFLDLDGFKAINDSLGHAIGDKLLREVGKRLTAAVRGSDTVSRIGGDEFVIVLSEIEHAQNAARQADKIRAALSAPYAFARTQLCVNASVGISLFPDDGSDAETLVDCADAAMYAAKEDGRNTHRFFERATNGREVVQAGQDDLRCALERSIFGSTTSRSCPDVSQSTR